MAFSDAQNAFNAAANFLAAGNFSSAFNQISAAQAFMAAVPDSGRSGDTVTFAQRIDALADRIWKVMNQKQAQAAGGMQSQKIRYRNPREYDDAGYPFGY